MQGSGPCMQDRGLCFGSQPHLQAAAGEGISAAARLFGRFGVSVGGLLGLLLCSQRVDLLARLEQAAVVLLLDLGANVVERHEGRGSLEIIVHLGCLCQHARHGNQ